MQSSATTALDIAGLSEATDGEQASKLSCCGGCGAQKLAKSLELLRHSLKQLPTDCFICGVLHSSCRCAW